MKRNRLRSFGFAFRILIPASTLVSCAACATTPAVREAHQPPDGDARKIGVPRMTASSEPGVEHEPLAALVGNWNAEAKMWNSPGEPLEQGRGKISNFWMLDDRFIGQEYKSRGQRPKYQGLGALGYDHAGGFYTSVWLDTTSTTMVSARGSYNKAGKVFTLEGKTTGPATNGLVRTRSVIRIVHKNKYTLELFTEGPDGKMNKTLEFTFTRRD